MGKKEDKGSQHQLETEGHGHALCFMVMGPSLLHRVVVGGWWLVVGGWQLVAVSGGWWLVGIGNWWLLAGGDWQFVAVGS